MLIKEIELNNFRIYKGKNKINLLPDGDKNIVVISGENGYGKTTFLMALVWCLYGKQMDKVDELYRQEIASNESYPKYITKSLNRLADIEKESQFSVSITFINVKIPEVTCNEIKITRLFNKNSTSDKLEILVDGAVYELSGDNPNGEEIFIRDFILPLEIAKFFFFDAEKIVSLAEVNLQEQRRALSKAYSEVLGIHKYEELRERLESIQYIYRKTVNSKERGAYIDANAKIEKIELEAENLDNEINELRRREDEKRHQSSKIQEALIRNSNNISIEQIDSLCKEKESLEAKYIEHKNGLKDFFDLIPFALAGEVLLAFSEQIEKEQYQKQNLSKNQEIDDKTSEILDELEKEKLKRHLFVKNEIQTFYENQFKLLIRKYFYTNTSESQDNVNILHDFSDNQVNQLNSSIMAKIKFSFKEKFSSFYNENNQLKTKISSLERKISQALKFSEEQHIKELRNKKEMLDSKVKELTATIEDKSQRIGWLNAERGRLKKERDRLKEKIEVAEAHKSKDAKLEELIKTIKKFVADFKEDKKRSLEIGIKEKLSSLMHKRDFIDSVTVDIFDEDINIELRNHHKQKIDKTSLSMGERQMYASALLSSLASESNIEFPVFIDSPMQKFDKRHAENILKNFYPNVSNQVIIFPLIHKELTEQEYQLIKEKVSKTYFIENKNNDSSQFVEVKNENLIAEYNKRYVTSN